jgi:hypothetical protein
LLVKARNTKFAAMFNNLRGPLLILFGSAVLIGLGSLGRYRWSDDAKVAAMKGALPKLDIPAGMDRYDAKLRHVFAEAYAPEVTLRCLITGGMWETALFLQDLEVVTLSTYPNSSVWDHEYVELVLDDKIKGWDRDGHALSKGDMVKSHAEVPISLNNYPTRRRSHSIPADLQHKLMAVWRDALEHAKADQKSGGLDGSTSTYFLRTAEGRTLAGSIWSPDTGPARAINNVAGATCNVAEFPDVKSATAELDDAITAYWAEARKRTPDSLELDHHKSDLGRRTD